MRYLGIDHGAKRIGLALSDPEGRIAFPHATVTDVAGVVLAIRKEDVERVVVGMPRTARGERGEAARAVERFVAKLRETVQLPIEFENELFTSQLAERVSAPERADASAAALILQSYLDKQRNK